LHESRNQGPHNQQKNFVKTTDGNLNQKAQVDAAARVAAIN
jgi:hypothetical protein